MTRQLSIGSYLAVAVTLIILVTSTIVVVDFGAHQRHGSMAAKELAAATVTSLFAGSVSAGLVFNDLDSVEKELANLKRASGIDAASVFGPNDAKPMASMAVRGEAPTAPRPPSTEIAGDQMIVAQEVVDTNGAPSGSVVVVFSLREDMRAIAFMQGTLVIRGLLLVVVTASLIVLIARKKLIRPLLALVKRANEIEEGNLHGAKGLVGANMEIQKLSDAFDKMGTAIADREQSLRHELEVAANLQVSVLPDGPKVRGLEIAACMQPATEVGGDYYDVIPVEDGCWIGIGDVSGHGLGAGVVMLMLQSAIGALVRANPNADPSTIEVLVNAVLFDNIRNRMKRRDHATLSILRYTRDGRVRHAGAHEDLIVWRKKTREIELVPTDGTWVGAMPSIASATVDSELSLEPGDIVVLYTDGITEARRDKAQFGLPALCDVVSANADKTSNEIRDAIVTAVHAWTAQCQDDISVVVLRHEPEMAAAAE